MLRNRFVLWLVVVAVFSSGVLLVYAQRTGQLTIFGDTPSLSGALTVTDPLDLVKGLDADGPLVADETGLHFQPSTGATQGRCQYDVGNPKITRFYRVRPLDVSLDAGSSLSLQFAGSLDGVSWSALSTPVGVTSETESVVDVTGLIPTGSHFLRTVCTLSRTTTSSQPSLGGLTINYDLFDAGSQGQLAVSADVVAANAALSINGQRPGSAEAMSYQRDTGVLAATGLEPGLILGALLLLLASGLGVWLLQRRPS